MNEGQIKTQQLRDEIRDVFPTPVPVDSLVFLMTELGEVADVVTRFGYGGLVRYLRGTVIDERDLRQRLVMELGDTYMMLCTLATSVGVDLDVALESTIQKLQKRAEAARGAYLKEGVVC